jgi:hypothetical protein
VVVLGPSVLPVLPRFQSRSFFRAAAVARAPAVVCTEAAEPGALVPIGAGVESFGPCVPLTTCAIAGGANVIVPTATIPSKVFFTWESPVNEKKKTPWGTAGFLEARI